MRAVIELSHSPSLRLVEQHRHLPGEGMRWRKIAEDLSVTVLVDVGIFIDRIIFQRFDGPQQKAHAKGILVLSIDAFVESQIPTVALAPQHLTRKAHHDLVWEDRKSTRLNSSH